MPLRFLNVFSSIALIMDVGGIFSKEVPTVDFSSGSEKDFSRGTKVVKSHFSLSKL